MTSPSRLGNLPCMANKTLKYLLLALLLGSLYPALSGAQPAMDLKLEGLDGQPHSLSEYVGHGKWTLLNIWGPHCRPCRYEIPLLNLFHRQHRDKDATVIAMALDFPSFGPAIRQDVQTFVDDYQIEIPILLGDDQLAGKLAGKPLRAVPTTHFFDPEGRLVQTWQGAVEVEELEAFIKDYDPEAERDWMLKW